MRTALSVVRAPRAGGLGSGGSAHPTAWPGRRIDRSWTSAAVRAPALLGDRGAGPGSGRALYARNAEQEPSGPPPRSKLVTTAAALDAFGPDARLRTTRRDRGPAGREGPLARRLYLVGRGDPNLSAPFAPRRPHGGLRGDGRRAAWRPASSASKAGSWATRGCSTGTVAGPTGTGRTSPGATGPRSRRSPSTTTPSELSLAPGRARRSIPRCCGCAGLGLPRRGHDRRHDRGAARRRADAAARPRLEPDPPHRAPLPLGGPWDGRARPRGSRPATRPPSSLECSRRRGIRVLGRWRPRPRRCPRARASWPRYDSLPTGRDDEGRRTRRARTSTPRCCCGCSGLKQKGEGSVASRHAAAPRSCSAARGSPTTAGGRGRLGAGARRPRDATGLVALLVAMDRHPHAAAFRDSLPVAGVDGTLEKRMRGTPAEKRVAGQDRHARTRQRPRRATSRPCAASARLRHRRQQPRGPEPRGGPGASDRVAVGDSPRRI